ncbi:MAG: L-threonylcarbamoyladenylate synthase [Thermoanaerobaculia bacterium]
MTSAELLAAGGVLAIPTESSYGLGVDPRDSAGVEAIYRLKGRERGKPLPVVAADVAQLLALGVEPAAGALAWAGPRWPAALTVVLPLAAPIPASAGGLTIAARIPAHDGLRALLLELGHALTATSANPSGEPPYTDPAEVTAWLAASGEKYLVVEQGGTAGGAPSTLVEIDDEKVTILRQGRVEVR